MEKSLKLIGSKTVTNTSVTIKNLINNKNNNTHNASIYAIQCLGCNKKIRDLQKRFYENKKDLKKGNMI